MGKEKILLISASIILIVSGLSSIYVYATTSDMTTITINAMEYTIDQLFLLGSEKIITVNGETVSGVALDVLMNNIGIRNPEQKQYTIIGKDQYQKTVTWENMQHGILTKNRQSLFEDLPKAFRVKDIIAIEVTS
ncbi:MAG: hypothetical protein QXL17_07035 [Candidatus Thermoplasmatota archaeon]